MPQAPPPPPSTPPPSPPPAPPTVLTAETVVTFELGERAAAIEPAESQRDGVATPWTTHTLP
eukprot:scaffold105234_cov39-Phaeocystis_antarctica.AAC.2